MSRRFPAPSDRVYLEENAGSADVELTADDLAALDAIMPPGAVAGDRYQDMTFIGGETPQRGQGER